MAGSAQYNRKSDHSIIAHYANLLSGPIVPIESPKAGGPSQIRCYGINEPISPAASLRGREAAPAQLFNPQF
jgi:hypothetical protein